MYIYIYIYLGAKFQIEFLLLQNCNLYKNEKTTRFVQMN